MKTRVRDSHCVPAGRLVRAVAAVFAAAAIAAVASGCGREANRRGPARLLPDPGAVPGIAGMGEIDEYRGEALYDFLDGGAELYFDYGIVEVASAEYRTAGDAPLEISVYDMGDAAGAFGIYSNLRYPGADIVAVGQEGMASASSLDFWKGRYYCRVVAFDPQPGTRAAMMTLGAALDAGIAEAGSVPGIVGRLPRKGMVPGSEKYFTRPIALNNIHYLGAGNVLNLDGAAEGASAAYELEGALFTAFLIEYPAPEEAGRALLSYRDHLGDEPGAMAVAEGRYLAGVWDLAGDKAAGFLAGLLAGLGEP